MKRLNFGGVYMGGGGEQTRNKRHCKVVKGGASHSLHPFTENSTWLRMCMSVHECMRALHGTFPGKRILVPTNSHHFSHSYTPVLENGLSATNSSKNNKYPNFRARPIFRNNKSRTKTIVIISDKKW